MCSYFENLHAKCHGGGAFLLGHQAELRMRGDCPHLHPTNGLACEPLFSASQPARLFVLHCVLFMFLYSPGWPGTGCVEQAHLIRLSPLPPCFLSLSRESFLLAWYDPTQGLHSHFPEGH